MAPHRAIEECALSTRTMRFRNPTKLGDSCASWLRQEVRCSECVAKKCRYLVSRMRAGVLLTACSVVLPLYMRWRLAEGARLAGAMSMLVWIAVSTMVAMVRRRGER